MADWKPRGSLRYPDYLHLAELLSLQRPVSDPPHHDETLFIIVHQAFELWFKLLLHSLDELGICLDRDDARGALKLARRAATIQRSLTQQIDILETMSALDFLEFRGGLEGASGFQSAQFRELEATLGLVDRDRVPVALEGSAPGRAAYFAPLLPAERARIEARSERPDLETRFLDCVVRTVGPRASERVHPADVPDLLEGRPEVARTLLSALEAQARAVEEDPAAARLLGTLRELPLWAGLTGAERTEVEEQARRGQARASLVALGKLGEEAPETVDLRLIDEELGRCATVPRAALEGALLAAALEDGERARIRSRLERRTALREVYRRSAHQRPDGALHDLWLLAEALLDLSQALALYRFRHVQMVERMIGKRRGTGGSPGAAYLEKTIAYRTFPEILRVRTHL